jgi:hypothetical protein
MHRPTARQVCLAASLGGTGNQAAGRAHDIKHDQGPYRHKHPGQLPAPNAAQEIPAPPGHQIDMSDPGRFAKSTSLSATSTPGRSCISMTTLAGISTPLPFGDDHGAAYRVAIGDIDKDG